MSDTIIIGIWSLLGSAILYLFVKQSQHEKRIAVAENNLTHTNAEIKELLTNLKSDIQDVKGQVRDDLKSINTRLDLFISNELQLLKNLIPLQKVKQ